MNDNKQLISKKLVKNISLMQMQQSMNCENINFQKHKIITFELSLP